MLNQIKKVSLVLLISLLTLSGCAPKAPDTKDTSTDILVIGGGGAGIVSAIYAAKEGKNVILIEKLAALGGNTIISATGITASDTVLHEQSGISFTKEDHFQRTMTTSKDLANPELVRILVDSSSDAIDWLIELGVKLKVRSEAEPFWIVPQEGHYGAQLFQAFINEANKYQNLEVRTSTKALELIVEDNKVVGAKVENQGETYTIKANAVVMATGGLNNNPEMIAHYNAMYKNIHTEMTTPGATGDGIIMGLAAGADLVDMEYFQVRPLSSNGNWYHERIVSSADISGILVNKEGNRFVNETIAPRSMAAEILKQSDALAYIIFDQRVAETADGKKAFVIGRGVKADSIAELAKLIDLDESVLVDTVEHYNEEHDDFGRTVFGKITEGPFYAIKTLPSNHYTMGGLKVNANAQVISKSGTPIAGLFAAGEVMGGLYGDGRVAGNNTLDDIVFGMIAGKNAAK